MLICDACAERIVSDKSFAAQRRFGGSYVPATNSLPGEDDTLNKMNAESIIARCKRLGLSPEQAKKKARELALEFHKNQERGADLTYSFWTSNMMDNLNKTPIVAGGVERTDESIVPSDRADVKKYLGDLQLKDDVPAEPKGRALLAFLAMGESAVDILLERIRSSGDRHERYAATEALGLLGYQSAFGPLHAMLGGIKDHFLLCHWNRTLGCLADRRAAEPLIQLGHALEVIPFNPAPLYRRMLSNAASIELIKRGEFGNTIARALGVVGDDSAIPFLVPLLGDDDFVIRDAAAETLVELGAAGIDALLAVALDRERPEELRRSPVRALGRSNDPRVVSVLIELLQDKKPHVRDEAISALRELMAAAEGESGLAVALDSLDPQVRRDLIAALAEDNDGRGFELLTNEVSAGNNPYARASAARALGKLGDERASDTLVPLLNSNEKELRQAGAGALGHIGDPAAIPALAKALKDREKEVRQAAALSLAYLKDARAFEPLLVALLPSKLAHYRLDAIDAFGSLGDVRAVEPLVRCLRWASGPERRAICATLRCLGTPAVDRLLVELADPRPLVRSKAALALGNIGAASTQEQLTKLLDDSDTQVKSAAAEALRELTVESGSSPTDRKQRTHRGLEVGFSETGPGWWSGRSLP
jgi:HEAT repeat protein